MQRMIKTKPRGRVFSLALALFAVAACGGEGEGFEPGDDTGSSQDPVIGGDSASLGEWPWQVQINNGGGHWCGGSVLSEEWVLTAAHCVDGVNEGALTLRAGLIDRTTPGPTVQSSGADDIQIHPDWSPFTIENDVALIHLSAPFTFDAHVQPIDIEENVVPVGTKAFVTGWGWTSGGGSSSNELMEAVLPVEDTATCNAAGTLGLTVEESMVCTGFVGGEKGGCHGDSGGPLVVQSGFSNGWKQVGVVSWGVGFSCDSYTVFSRLSFLAPWINGIVGAPPVLGDATGDGCVDMTDYAALLSSFGQNVPPADPALDFNSDGIINIHDRLVILQNFGEGC